MDLTTTRLQVEAAKDGLEKTERELEECRKNLGSTEEQRSRLEHELVSLKHTLGPLEEAQVQAGEAHRLKEEEMDRQLKKMEQILEEELEQFETLIQAKEDEVSKHSISCKKGLCGLSQVGRTHPMQKCGMTLPTA